MELVRIVKATAPLSETETEQEAANMVAGHYALKDHGMLMSSIEYDRHGKPKNIVSYWENSSLSGSLSSGHVYVDIPVSLYNSLKLPNSSAE